MRCCRLCGGCGRNVITSFGYAYGDPPAADQVFDERDLTHKVNSLAFNTELSRITDYAQRHPDARIAIGCERGQHRSVTLARLAAMHTGHTLAHRDARTR